MARNDRKARALCRLHDSKSCFVIPNPWDVGSARILTAAGFKALATTGAGLAYSRGEPNGYPGREAILENATEIANAVSVPVSADLENGFGDEPAIVADTISRAIEAGLAGGSIEDANLDGDDPIYPVECAVERIEAAAAAVRASGIPFQLVARAENYLYGRPDLGDTIDRLQRFQEAGADVLYAPGLASVGDIRAIVSSVDLPVNVVMGRTGDLVDFATLKDLGVARISIGSSLQRLAYGALDRAAREMIDGGTFSFAADALTVEELDRRFDPAPDSEVS